MQSLVKLYNYTQLFERHYDIRRAMEKWRDKVAVITGASSGIGAALARRLVKEGMFVAGCARRLDRLKELQSHFPPDRFLPVQCDITRESDSVQAFEHIDQVFGRVDVLINNAGVGRLTSLVSPSSEALRTLLATNIIGHCLMTREALRIMHRNRFKTGYIIFTNSVAGHTDTPPSVELTSLAHPYMISKRALRVIVEGLRAELFASGSRVRVGEVSPGPCLTEIMASAIPLDTPNDDNNTILLSLHEAFQHVIPLDVDDVVEAFVFILAQPDNANVSEVIVRNI